MQPAAVLKFSGMVIVTLLLTSAILMRIGQQQATSCLGISLDIFASVREWVFKPPGCFDANGSHFAGSVTAMRKPQRVYVSPFGIDASKKRRIGADAHEGLTEMEKKALEAAPKRKQKAQGDFAPKRNVRKGKSRKR